MDNPELREQEGRDKVDLIKAAGGAAFLVIGIAFLGLTYLGLKGWLPLLISLSAGLAAYFGAYRLCTGD